MTGQDGPPRRAAARAGPPVLGWVGAREILARSDLVVIREEFVAIAAENLRLRGGRGSPRRTDSWTWSAAGSEMYAERDRRRAVHAALIRAMEATYAAEIA